ncbi:MAG: cobalamin-binding protein [Proteobacteria bacterium]|nr:cobalamin-binding protein [Pseudomonadota bacterium]MBU1738580.1 cobalamin-binding protein [Pseudomonadota bacterium]
MKISSVKIIFVILALFWWIPVASSARTITDQIDRAVELPERISRVVSLAPSITEVVYSLGRQELLVGATLYSDDPPEAKLLPRVGSYVQLDLEKILALKPDLCLAIKDGNPRHTVERIMGMGIPVYVVDPKSLAGIIEMISGLGALLGAGEKAAMITSDMRKRIKAVHERLAGAHARPGVFFQIDAEPIVSAGPGTFIHELITTAGGRNLAGEGAVGSYPKFSWEDILGYQPEVAIVASMAGGFSVEALKAGWFRWPQIPAVKNNRVHVIDAALVDRPTPRLIDGLETFAGIIHPEIFGELVAK